MSERQRASGAPLVIGIGEVLWDLLPGGRVLGGAPANMASHVSRLGSRAAAVSAVGSDGLGEEALERVASLGVDVGGISIVREQATGTVEVTFAADGEPTYRIAYPAAWDFIPVSETATALAASADAICYGTLAQRGLVSRASIRTLIDVTAPRCLRVFDVNLRVPWVQDEVIADLLERSSVVKLNESELARVADILGVDGSEDARLEYLAARYRLRLVALTRGSAGCHLVAVGQHAIHGGFPVSTPVDTVGAGDAFTAALVLGILRDMPLQDIAEASNRVASEVCGHSGALPASTATIGGVV